ncbi:MFS transporter [Novosphingobium colocasiae]
MDQFDCSRLANARSWTGVTLIAAATFLLVTSEVLPIALLSPIARGFGISEGTAGLSITAPGIVAAITAPLLTILAGRIDRRTIIIVLTLAVIASNVIAMLASTFTVFFIVGRLILGLAVGGLWSFAVAVGRRLVPEAAGARATSIIVAGISAGTVCGMPVGAVASDLSGWRTMFAVIAALGLVVAIMQMRILPRLPTVVVIDGTRLLGFAKVPMARIGLISSSFVGVGHFIAYTFIEPYLRDTLSLGRSGIAVALTGYAVAGIAGTFVGERLATRDVRRALVITAIAVGLCLVAAVAATSVPIAGIGVVVLWGLAFGAFPVCVQIWMFTSSPSLFEAGSALMVSSFQVALAVGAAIGGVLVDTTGILITFLVGEACVPSVPSFPC